MESSTFYRGVTVIYPLQLFLRPKCPAGLINLAQCPCPRETRCKTSCAKRFS